MENEQGQTITPGEALGRFLSYAGAWLSRLPDLFQAMSRPYAVTTIALEAVLLKRGLIDPAELAAAKKEADAGFLIETTIGAAGRALEADMAAFHSGAIAAITAPSPPGPADADAAQALRRVFDLATIEKPGPLALRIGDQEYAAVYPFDLPLVEANMLKQLEVSEGEEGRSYIERINFRAQQLRLLVPALTEDAVEKLTSREITRALGFIWQRVGKE